jgi:hypothetical protein
MALKVSLLATQFGSIEKVEWDSGPAKADESTPYFEHPIVWSGGES